MTTTSSQFISVLMKAFLHKQMVSVELTDSHLSGSVIGIRDSQLFLQTLDKQITKIPLDQIKSAKVL
ncbi:hypothetical protein PL11_002220 [Lentilactobacillus curieae]|uniref:LSM domain-containing protein n=1 Tax=Lentilactobacillus curieae TaxID=1138822 RepID=A0A1S6QGT5_9LACO|nr:hypothetical protein [Lentilactobacillus curieae]AQW20812.1 hypothetical protein PL11_002220 [Lentilactobacillus curieae]